MKLPIAYRLFSLLMAAGLMASCSTENNTAVSRAYHSLTSKYNIYFNGYESFKRGIRKAENAVQDDYTRILPVFPISAAETGSSITPEMEKAIRKASKVITLHSITARPKEKNRQLTEKEEAFYAKKEYNNWIDDAYLLMAKSQFYKKDLYLAERTYRHIILNYDDEKLKAEARTWLARTYTELGNYREAQRALDLVEARRDLPVKLRKLHKASYADFFIRQEKFPQAIPHLTEALELAKRKKDRSRYAFILAQLHERSGNEDEASALYRRVIRMNPSYELVFNARINLAGTFDVENRDSREIRKELRKMLRDEKNIDYRDQIYYALGRISQREGNTQEAIDFYKESAGASISNNTQKGVSYLAIADIYFSRLSYREAQAFYDSAVLSLNQAYPDYDRLYAKSRNLNQLVGFIQAVEREDSLQYVASLDENARNIFIDNLIQKIRQQEQEERQQEMEMQRNTMMYYQNQARFRDDFSEGGKWYFYNQSAIGFGQMEFKRKWGERKLEDNWRRANKSLAVFDSPVTAEGEPGSQGASAGGEQMDNKSREYYMRDLPLTDSLLLLSHNRIKEALFGVGRTYMELLSDYPRAIETMEELNRRYAVHPNQLESYYDLYRMYTETGNTSKANTYKSLILEEYPESEAASIITDPRYLERRAEQYQQAENDYQSAFALYQEGRYGEAISLSDQALSRHRGHPLVPRFRYLRAVSNGQLAGVRVLKEDLQQLTMDFPQHEVARLANDVIAIINQENQDIKQEEVEKQAEEIYLYNPGEKHYVLMVLNPSYLNLRQLSFNIINYNIEYHTNDNYETVEEDLDNQLKIVTVQEFADSRLCLEYLAGLMASPDVFRGMILPPNQPMIISASNYQVLLGDKNLDTYQAFYKKMYTGE